MEAMEDSDGERRGLVELRNMVQYVEIVKCVLLIR